MMAIPVVHRVEPSVGPAAGGNLVRVAGDGFAPRVRVRFGTAPAHLVRAWVHAGLWTLEVSPPAHDAGEVDLAVENLDATGVPVPGEIVTARGAYEYQRPQLVEESDLARLVRTLIRGLKREVLSNVHVAVHIDHDDTPADGLRVTTMAQVPSLVLSGPSVRPSSAYRTAEPIDAELRAGEVLRYRRRLTVDLAFTITGASRSTVEVLGLLTATSHFISRNPWISMLRDPTRPGLGLVRWDVDPEGDWRTQIPGPEGVHAFTAAFTVRGFDLDEGLVRERLRRVETVAINVGAVGAAGASS
jgi:hypothetical protein